MKKDKGVALVTVLMTMMLMLLVIPAIIDWLITDTRLAIKIQKSTLAYNLAEGAVDRGIWKLKASTATWSDAYKGIAISNYNFDKTFDDITGGYYRIKFASGPSDNQVTITGEGKDLASKETRSIVCVVENITIPGALFSAAGINVGNHFAIDWGPIVAQNDIALTDAQAAKKYFPRKLSRQVVTGQGVYVRDTNGLDSPNTDNLEWWSDYDVPDMPSLDFTSLRSSADANGTLNICDAPVKGQSATECRFENSYNHVKSQNNLIWYWDNPIGDDTTVNLEGSVGIWGTVIVRGNMEWSGSDSMSYVATVPSNAWKEYQKCDTSAINEYPADSGLNSNRTTFNLSTETWTWGNGKCYESNSDVPASGGCDVSFRGFIYVGSNLDIAGGQDVHGALWVVGTVSAGGGGISHIFFDHQIKDIPTLNIVLEQKSWKEQIPNTQAWVDPT
ncbi:MAG: hypothetical protein HY747_07580 [Elusimicrobia bacterium]|nr:hypothetical protein [Elusimicrobiota bacterium]